jgi:hypothetical protein
LSNISFVFWALEFQEKLLSRFTDVYVDQITVLSFNRYSDVKTFHTNYLMGFQLFSNILPIFIRSTKNITKICSNSIAKVLEQPSRKLHAGKSSLEILNSGRHGKSEGSKGGGEPTEITINTIFPELD